MIKLSTKQKKSPEQKTEPLHSSETNTDNFVSAPTPTSPLVISLHHSCKTCPLTAFIEAYSNNNYELLGTGTPEQVAEAWNEILFDWATLIKTEQSEYLLDLGKRMGLLEAQINYVENAVEYLKIEWDEEIAEGLRSEGFDASNLEMALSLAKRLVFDLNDLRDEYIRLTNTVQGKKKSEDEFNEDIAMLSKFQHYNIDPDTTTVKKYASIFNMYLKQHKTQANVS